MKPNIQIKTQKCCLSCAATVQLRSGGVGVGGGGVCAMNSRTPLLPGHHAHAVRVLYYAHLLQDHENARQNHQQNNQSTQSSPGAGELNMGQRGDRTKGADIGEGERWKRRSDTCAIHEGYLR